MTLYTCYIYNAIQYILTETRNKSEVSLVDGTSPKSRTGCYIVPYAGLAEVAYSKMPRLISARLPTGM